MVPAIKLELETILLRLSLDGQTAAQVCGMDGFPILSVEEVTVFAFPKTVLAKDSRDRFSPRPGLAYVGVSAVGEPVSTIAGRDLFPGRSETTLDSFIERFGDLFKRNEIEIECPDDPFESILRMA